MIGDIGASRPIDVLVKVSYFDSASAGEVGLPAEAQEESILIEPAVGSPVRVIEMDEDFIPGHEAEPRCALDWSARTDKLAKSPTCIRACFKKPLLES